MILASDGVANVGLTDPQSILGRIKRDASAGIQLVTVGVGMGNYNDVLLEQLADQGDGFYAYVDTLDEARRLFVDDLTSTLDTVALDAKVQVDFDPHVVAKYRLIGFENRAVPDDQFRNNHVAAGAIGAGHEVTALYAIRLAEDVRPGDRIGTVTLRWTDPTTQRTSETSLDVDGRGPRGLVPLHRLRISSWTRSSRRRPRRSAAARGSTATASATWPTRPTPSPRIFRRPSKSTTSSTCCAGRRASAVEPFPCDADRGGEEETPRSVIAHDRRRLVMRQRVPSLAW